MKKTLLLSAVSLLLVSCNSQFPKRNALGGAKDKHGCLASAGQTWSELRQTCLQIFNEGIRLNPIQLNKKEAVVSAFVLFDDKKDKVEVFLPSETPNLILTKTKGHWFENGEYRYDAQSGTLWIKGVAKYQMEAMENLIVYYDIAVGDATLMAATEEYGAKLLYRYKALKGIAIAVPKEKTQDAISYFKKVKGVLSVSVSQTHQLHSDNGY